VQRTFQIDTDFIDKFWNKKLFMPNLTNSPAHQQRCSNACHPQSQRDEFPSFGPENKTKMVMTVQQDTVTVWA
jgi:hypothetical protein